MDGDTAAEASRQVVTFALQLPLISILFMDWTSANEHKCSHVVIVNKGNYRQHPSLAGIFTYLRAFQKLVQMMMLLPHNYSSKSPTAYSTALLAAHSK